MAPDRDPRVRPLAVTIAVVFAAATVAATSHRDPGAESPAVEAGPPLVVSTPPVQAPGAADLVASGRVAPIATGGPVVALRQRGFTVPVVGGSPGSWTVLTPCGDEAIAGGAPLRDAHVVLDPGHGGDEPGALGPAGSREADLNLAVALAVRDRLRAHGLTVVMTRATDVRLTLETRARLATALRPDAFVSIHHNADPDGPLPRPGTETYFQVADPESRRLSGLVHEEVVSTLGGFDVAWVGDTDAGAKFRRNGRGGDYYGVLRRSAGVPATLAEIGFVSNAAEEALYRRPEVTAAVADAITRALVRYLTTEDPGSGFTDPYPRTTPAGGGGGSAGCVDPPLEPPA